MTRRVAIGSAVCLPQQPRLLTSSPVDLLRLLTVLRLRQQDLQGIAGEMWDYLLVLGLLALGSAPSTASKGPRLAALPIQHRWRLEHAPTPEDASSPGLLVQDASHRPFVDLKKPKHKFKPHFFDQRITHFPSSHPLPTNHSSKTFKQRYWFDDSCYKEGGPVILLDGGETSGEGRLAFLETGIVRKLMEELNGIGVIVEHRYYGVSFPFSDLSTSSLAYLDTAQALADNAHLSANLVLPGLEHFNLSAPDTAHIWYGGSYAGAKVAMVRKVYGDVVWGAIASSAVTHAQVDYWQYFETIRVKAPSDCMANLEVFTSFIDSVLALNKSSVTDALKWAFGMPNVTDDRDFVNVLVTPLGAWQARNWDPKVSTTAFDTFCDAVTDSTNSSLTSSPLAPVLASLPPSFLPTGFPLKAFVSYAQYFRHLVGEACKEEKQNECFGSGKPEDYREDGLDQKWRSWIWQVCTEWGYFQDGAPEGHPTIVSRLIDVEYDSRICRLAFGDAVPKRPDIEKVNRYGDFNLTASRLAFVDGESDPWLYATPHSPSLLPPPSSFDPPSPSPLSYSSDSLASSRPPSARNSTSSRPFILIPNAVHHWDENGLPSELDEPKFIRKVHEEEKAFVREWMKDFYREMPGEG